MEGINKSQQTEQVRLNDILNALDSGEMHPEHKSSSHSGGNTYKKSDGYTQPKKDFWVSIPNHEAHTGPSPVQESHGNESFSSHEKEEKPSAYSQAKSERFDPYAIYDKPILSSEIPDYLILGEATPGLSGGEAQRLKLASEMGRGQGDTLFVFDEPTIGLHPLDVRTLMDVFRHLIKNGATVIVIEHDLDVIRAADWIVDMGPGGGKDGGRIVAVGTPDDIKANPQSITGRYI